MSNRAFSAPRPRPTARRPARRGALAVSGVLALSLTAAACSGSAQGGPASSSSDSADPAPSSSAPTTTEASVTSNLPKGGAPVAISKLVRLEAHDGTFDTVRVLVGGQQKPLAGKLSSDKTTWSATQRLEPGVEYKVNAVAVDENGLKATERREFSSAALTLDEQTYPSFAPLSGETVGVGMPVIITFDVPVTNKKSIEQHLSVESSPQQTGAWHWLSDTEVHWRPKTYWQPGTDVTVNADINSIPAGDGVWGQLSRKSTFTVGDSVVSKINVQTHQMQVFVNGKIARTIPISAGKPGFTTRSGTKVIIEKFRSKRMDAATTGISEDDPEYYNLSNVEYAMRVTYSGEFLHAAPWSVGSQGSANVSHGCVGMSTDNAAWLYNMTKRGDVVEVTGSDRYMTVDNGYGDWNETFAEWKQGSALS